MKHLKAIALLIVICTAFSCQCTPVRYETPQEGSEGDDSGSGAAAVDTVFLITLTGEDCPYADKADYGFYVPAGIKRLQGVLVLQHGCGMEQFGITRNYDLQYRAFARKWNLAVVETALHGPCGVWCNPESGSADGLLKALYMAGRKTSHSELSSLPWLLWGHSAGGYWVLAMLRDYPERIIAGVCYSAAWDPSWDYSDAAAEVPVLLRHAGIDDGDASSKCPETAHHTFDKLRTMGAPASIVLNKGQNHNLSYLRTMAIPFWEAALKQRLTGSGSLKPLDKSQIWLGDTTTFEIYREEGFTADKHAMCRFPDRASAEAWREFATTNCVVDKTPPEAPYALQVIPQGEVLQLTWQAEADIESGIQCFNVYKDGQLAGRIPETGVFQSFDFNGDNTYPVPPPAMSFRLTGSSGAKMRLGVEAVNRDGLHSTITEIYYKP